MTIFLSDMETCFAYMLLLPMGHECFFYRYCSVRFWFQCDYVNIRSI